MKTMKWMAIAGMCLTFALVSATAGAQDTVWLKNGDRVTGTVKHVSGTDLVVDVYGAEVKLGLGDIKSFTSNTPMRVALADGAILKGKVTAREGGGIDVQQPEGSVPVTDLASLTDMFDPLNMPDSKKKWTGQLIGAGSISGGNTRERAGRIDLEVEGDLDEFRVKFLAGGEYGDSAAAGGGGRTLTTRKAFGLARLDKKLNDRAYIYGRALFQGDEFQNLSLRSTYGAGFGYRIIDKPHQLWDMAIGASWVDEDNDNGTRVPNGPWLSGQDKAYATADASLDYRVDLTEDLTFTQKAVVFQSLKESEDLRGYSKSALDLAVSKTISANLAFLYEYNANPDGGTKKEDWKVLAGIGYRFW